MLRKKRLILFLFLIWVCRPPAYADTSGLETYVSGFDLRTQKEMKMDSPTLVHGIREGKILLVDIRFRQEVKAGPLPFGVAIPLNELPKRLAELPKNQLIVTACPVKDRAIIAMVYLKTKGFNVKYLNDGLIGLSRYLRQNPARHLHLPHRDD